MQMQMQILVLLVLSLILSTMLPCCNAQETLYGYSVQDAQGNTVSLEKYAASKVVIVVNVASFCGYTYTNYRGLMDLYERYHEHGLEILAFPSNQFGEQEPKSNAEIQDFCGSYGVTVPVLGKVDVNGPGAIPLFKFLKQRQFTRYE